MKSMYESWQQEPSMERYIVLIMEGGYVRRFHNVNTLGVDLVGQHSNRVAMLCVVMTPRNQLNVSLLINALGHDLAESISGDIPAPAKIILDIKDACKKFEEGVLARHSFYEVLSESEQQTFKIADCLDGMLTCVAERRLGNRNVEPVYAKFMKYISVYSFTPLQAQAVNAVHVLWEESMSEPLMDRFGGAQEKMKKDYEQGNWDKKHAVAESVAANQTNSSVKESAGKIGTANSVQVGGDHYHDTTGRCPECGAPIQHWDLYGRQPYLEGQITKYVTRWRDKNGVEDLVKARHYLDKLMEMVLKTR